MAETGIVREEMEGATSVKVPAQWFPPILPSVVHGREVECVAAEGLDVSIRSTLDEVCPEAFLALSMRVGDAGMYMGFRLEALDQMIAALQRARPELAKITGARDA